MTKLHQMSWRQRWSRRPSWLAWIGRHELGTLVVLTAAAMASWGFFELADEVREGDTQKYDRQILLALRHTDDLSVPIGPEWFAVMMRDVTAVGGPFVLVGLTLAVAGYLALEGKRHAAVMVPVAVFGGMVAGQILKFIFERPRPDVVPHLMVETAASFPSGHSMGAAVTYLTLGALLARVTARKRVKAYFMLMGVGLSVAVGFSRMYLGVHWPTDVLAGWTAGAAWALLCWTAARFLQRRGKVERDTDPPTSD